MERRRARRIRRSTALKSHQLSEPHESSARFHYPLFIATSVIGEKYSKSESTPAAHAGVPGGPLSRHSSCLACK